MITRLNNSVLVSNIAWITVFCMLCISNIYYLMTASISKELRLIHGYRRHHGMVVRMTFEVEKALKDRV